MAKSFAIRKFEQGWALVFGQRRVDVVGVGKENQRYFDSREALVEKLTSLKIEPNEYDVVEDGMKV